MNVNSKNILKYINKINYKYNFILNESQFLSYIYHLNLLIFKLFKIYNNKKLSKQEKINMIYNLKDIDGNIFLTEIQAIYIYNNYAKKISNFYKKIYKLRKNKNKSLPYNGYGGSIENNIKEYSSTITNYINKNSVLFNWIFFPLWSIENLPGVGQNIEIPLDILGIILDISDVILKPLSQLIGPVTGSLIDVAQAIPGVGTAVSIVAPVAHLIEEPLEYLLENFTEIISMYINLSRKQWGLAYMSALECIPLFADTVDLYLQFVITSRKYLININEQDEYIRDILSFINQRISSYIPMVYQVLENPKIIIDPHLMFNNILLPNINNIPELNKISKRELNNINQKLKQISPYIKQPFFYFKNPENFFIDIIFPMRKNFPFVHDSILNISSRILNKINRSLIKYNNS